MTGPPLRAQDTDPLEILKAMKAAKGGPDPLEELKAMRASASNDIHAQYRSGALQKRMAAGNAADEAAAQPGIGERIAAHAANIAQGIPGMQAVEAGVGALTSRFPGMGPKLSYRESYNALEDATNRIPTAGRIGERILGGAPLAAALPGNPATAGAILGGADVALSGDPDKSLTDRAWQTPLAAGAGALTGKALDLGVNAVRAKLFTPEPNALTKQLTTAASDAAKPGYKAFRDLGDLGSSPKLDALVGRAGATVERPASGLDAIEDQSAPIRDKFGNLRRNLKNVSDEDLETEWQRLAEMNRSETGLYHGVEESGYRGDYYELPETERIGAKGQEDLPDADGMIDPETLAEHNKIVSGYRRSQIVRNARDASIKRIQDELDSRRMADATDFNFGANVVQPESPAILGLPIIRRAIETVKGESPTLAKLPDTDARVLDAVYKRVGRRAFASAHGYETGEARNALLEAIEEAAQAKGGSYQQPVSAYRNIAQEASAVQRGKQTLNQMLSPAGGGKTAPERTPEALREWFEARSTRNAERDRAIEGLLGQAGRRGVIGGRVPFTRWIPYPSQALRGATSLANQLDPSRTDQTLLLLAALNGARANR